MPTSLDDACETIDILVEALTDLLSCAESECVSGSSYAPIEQAKLALWRFE